MFDEDELLRAIEKSNLSDGAIDDVVARASAYHEASRNDESRAILEKVKEAAAAKKNNKDISYAENIEDFSELRAAINGYGNRPVNPEKEWALAKSLENIIDNKDAEKISGKEVYNVARQLEESNTILDSSLSAYFKEDFAGYVAAAYTMATNDLKANFNPHEAKNMLYSIDSMSDHLNDSALALASVATRLDDRSVAETFLALSEKNLQKMDAAGKDVLAGSAMIEKYAEVMKNHPDMAAKCNNLVKQTVDMDTTDDRAFTLEAAIKFSEAVNTGTETNESAKAVARIRRKRYEQQLERARKEPKVVEPQAAQTYQANQTYQTYYQSSEDYRGG